jgi:tetratricopeptide (TPR) repeat protein
VNENGTACKDSIIAGHVLQLTYPDNPITHKTITFSSGRYSELLPDGKSRLTISIDTISNIDTIGGCSTPCIAVILSADSGKGTIHYFLTTLNIQKEQLKPISYQYLGTDIKVANFKIDIGCIEIWWFHSLAGEDTKTPHHIICRAYSLEGRKLVDYEYQSSQERKHEIECDTVFSDSVKTGAWVVKWNRTRARAFNMETGTEKEIYTEVFADIDDVDYIIPAELKGVTHPPASKVFAKGDTITVLAEHCSEKKEKKEVSPYWQYWKKYEMLSIVGPYISFAGTIAKDEMDTPDFAIEVVQLDGDINSSGYFTGVGSSKVPLDWVGAPEPLITGIFGEDVIFKDLLNLPQIRTIFHDTLPGEYNKFRWDERVKKVLDVWDFERYFYFAGFSGTDSVVIRFGRASVIYKMISEVVLPIPKRFIPIFADALKNKSTTNYINPDFLINRKPLCLVAGNNTVQSNQRLKRRNYKLYENFLKEGKSQEEENNISEAIEAYTHALRFVPNGIKALLYRAQAELDFEQEKALVDCNKILSLDSNNIQGLYLRGQVFKAQNQYKKALTDLDRVVQLDTLHELDNVYSTRANILWEFAKYSEAMTNFNFEIQLHPDNFTAHCDRALLYKALRNYKMALADFSKCVELSPDQPYVMGWMGYCYIELKQYTKALECFEKRNKIDSRDFNTYLGIAISYYQLRNIEKALFNLEYAIAMEPVLQKGMDGITEIRKYNYFFTNFAQKALAALFELRQNPTKKTTGNTK